jgi:hypothetical protein
VGKQMAFNADKSFVIRAGTKHKTIKQDYTIHKLFAVM